jgi:intracellular multiplication protein IcmG
MDNKDINQDFDDISFEEEDYDFEDDAFDEGESDYPEPVKKSSLNWFNILIFGGLAIAVIGLSYIYLPSIFGGGNQDAQQQTPVVASDTLQPSEPASQQNIAEAAVTDELSGNEIAEGGLLDNPDMFADTDDQFIYISAQEDNAVFDEINAQLTTNAEDDLDIFFPDFEPAQNNDQQTMAEMDEVFTPALPDINVANNTQEEVRNTVPAEPMVVMTEPMETQRIDDQPQNNLQTPLENSEIAEMKATMNILSQQMADIMDMVQSQSDDKGSDDISTLQTSIERLEARLRSLEDNTPQQSSDTASQTREELAQVEVNNNTTLQESETIASPAPQPVKKVEVREPRPAQPVVVSTPERSRISWQLRGASPEQAFLANQANGAVTTVSLGQTVPGLGRIESIAVENGRWVVRGTNGIVRQ